MCRSHQQQQAQSPQLSLARTPSLQPPSLRPPSRSRFNALPKLELGTLVVVESPGSSARKLQAVTAAEAAEGRALHAGLSGTMSRANR